MTQQLQTILSLLKTHVQPNQESGGGVKFNKKLLDFDYSDDEDGPNDPGAEQQPSPAMLEALQGILGKCGHDADPRSDRPLNSSLPCPSR